jgi:hypothetical protein
MSDEKVKRAPVNYLYTGLNWEFIKLQAEIAKYAAGKYGSATQYANGKLEGDKDPLNHIYEHARQFQAGEVHDHFGTLEHQLAAIAYNASMKFFELKKWGFVAHPLFGVGLTTELPATSDVAEVFTPAPRALKDGEGGVLPVNTVVETPRATAEWAEGLSEFHNRWRDGHDRARDPGAIRRWQAMLWVMDQFAAVDLSSDAAVFLLLDDITRDAKEAMFAEKTPENIETQQAKMAACDTIRGRIPEMFPKKKGGG